MYISGLIVTGRGRGVVVGGEEGKGERATIVPLTHFLRPRALTPSNVIIAAELRAIRAPDNNRDVIITLCPREYNKKIKNAITITCTYTRYCIHRGTVHTVILFFFFFYHNPGRRIN